MSGKAARKSRQWTWAHDIDYWVAKVMGHEHRTDQRSVARRYRRARRIRRAEDARRESERRLFALIKRHRKPTGQRIRWGGQMVYAKHLADKFDAMKASAVGGIGALLLVVVL